ncbi:hypothetical protein E2320_006114, partial [Naja naja]
MAAGCRGDCCGCCCCCCGERESRTPEELTILGETEDEDDEILPRKDYEVKCLKKKKKKASF